MKIIRRLEHFCFEGKLRKSGLFRLEKRRLHGDLAATFQHLKQGLWERWREILHQGLYWRTRLSDFKLEESKLRLDTRKIFFAIRVVEHWNSWVLCQCMCSQWGWMRICLTWTSTSHPCPWQTGQTTWSLKVFSTTNHSVI